MWYAEGVPRFEPFRAVRYDVQRVDLSAVIAPPYDVIDPDERRRLAGRHSASSVRVELPEPDHRAGLDRYAHAAVQLRDWLEQRTLVRDAEPSLYAYRMTTAAGRATNGVLGALGINDADARDILPHEQTLPKAKSDRLDLLSATRCNLSPIWGLSMTTGLTRLVVSDNAPDARAVDDDGTAHELWVLDEPRRIDAITGLVASSPVVVADGHHRFETARAFFAADTATDDRGAGGKGPDQVSQARGAGSDLVLAFVVELAEDQLEVGAIHRGLSGLPDGIDLTDAFGSWFDLTRAGDLDERTITALGESHTLALITPSGCWLLAPRDGTAEAAGADLDSAMVELVRAELPEHEVVFRRDWRHAARAVADGTLQAAVLIRPVTVRQIADWADRRRRMPPKTTYFSPKPRTGMVFRTIDDPGAGPAHRKA